MSADIDAQNALYARLAQFTCSDASYYCAPDGLHYTEGVRFLVEKMRAEWLVHAITRLQSVAFQDGGLTEFQLWELAVKEDGSATLTCSRASDDPVFRESIVAPGFPLSYVRLYVQGGVLMLPSEH